MACYHSDLPEAIMIIQPLGSIDRHVIKFFIYSFQYNKIFKTVLFYYGFIIFVRFSANFKTSSSLHVFFQVSLRLKVSTVEDVNSANAQCGGSSIHAFVLILKLLAVQKYLQISLAAILMHLSDTSIIAYKRNVVSQLISKAQQSCVPATALGAFA